MSIHEILLKQIEEEKIKIEEEKIRRIVEKIRNVRKYETVKLIKYEAINNSLKSVESDLTHLNIPDLRKLSTFEAQLNRLVERIDNIMTELDKMP